ncbi:MAG: V-type ATPase subunit [Oscillospiraceae bacterium]|nr:V-type ATPase subunit [Oscillospiraceae bacterium]
MSDLKKCENTKYLFLTSMIRAREAGMLTADKVERMLTAPGFAEACAVAADCGYPDMNGMSIREVEDTLSAHRRAEIEDIALIVPDSELVDLFRLKYDYHSAKVMIKSDGVHKELLSFEGRVEAAEFLKAFAKNELVMLPVSLAEAIVDAKSMLARTGNPCLADLILDRAYFAEMAEMAKTMELPFAENYVKLLIDSTNLKVLVRSRIAGKRPEIVGELLFEGGSILKESIVEAAENDDEAQRLFASAGLADAAEKGFAVLSGGSMTVFELALDNTINEYLSDAVRIGFGPAVVISYLAAVENEVMTLRIILTGRLMGISQEALRGRLRDSYV